MSLDGTVFIWPATLKPSSPTVGAKRATLHQPTNAETAWVSGDLKDTLVPIILSGEVTFDSEYAANQYIIQAKESLHNAVKLIRLEKQGALYRGANSLVPATEGDRAHIVTLTLTLMPLEFPYNSSGKRSYW